MGSGRHERARVRAAQQGSAADLEALFEVHWPRAYRAAYLVTHDAAAAEDIAQEAFLAAIRNLDRFDRRRPFGPWLHRIVVNRAIDWTRARRLRAEVELGESQARASEPDLPGDDVLAALARLPPDTAFARREPAPRPSRWPRVAAVAFALAAIGAAALSSPGRAVLTELREVVGVKRAQPALFSLPAPGRLLVASDAGVWVVEQDGSKRLLGEYREASWSPFGRFVVAAKANELAALEPDGDVRWTLARPGVRSPRWTGTEADTRIAYVDRTGLRVVAGDGTRDRLLVPGYRGPLAWEPGPGFVLASVGSRGRVLLRDAETGRVLARSREGARPRELAWSDDGRRLLAVAPFEVRLLDGRARWVTTEGPSDGTKAVANAFRPRSREIVEIRREGSPPTYGSNVFRWGDGRSLFRSTGEFRELAWSPDGRWLLVSWPTADQWVFVRASGAKRIRAVAGVSEQFRSRSAPRIEGWCCAR
jgi:RNA polymerase sigma-70 factor (ECF subfamily)